MKKKLAVCAASMVIIVMGGTFLARPARAAGNMGPCPTKVAEDLMSVAEKTCKKQGKEVLVTWMDCTGDGSGSGSGDFAYECV